jgi:anti-sigma factor RsiW
VLGETPVALPAQRSRWWLAAAAAVVLVVGGPAAILPASMASVAKTVPKTNCRAGVAAHVIYAAEKRHAVEVPASDKDHLQTRFPTGSA